jgi:hypothetical protein
VEKELALYVSASREMDPECELVGQLLASMPRSVRWVIKRTPGSHEQGNPDLAALRASRFYLILLGMDITAPIGVEWLTAQGAGLTTFAYQKASVVASPAASVFVRRSGVTWEQYRTPQEFARHFERALIIQLISGTPGYGLEMADIEELAARLRALGQDAGQPGSEERRGAGRGGVILPQAGDTEPSASRG